MDVSSRAPNTSKMKENSSSALKASKFIRKLYDLLEVSSLDQ